MKAFVIGLALLALPATTPAWAASTDLPPELVTASATSFAEGSSSVICLLDPQCVGYWSPMSRDDGANEGILLQFREPMRLRFLEVVIEGGELLDTSPFRIYFDAKTTDDGKRDSSSDRSTYIQISSTRRGDDTRFIAALANDANDDPSYAAKSVFIKLRPTGVKTPMRIRSIRLFDAKAPDAPDISMAPITLRLPAGVPATVSATSVLEPAFAYDASHLFDSQLDMAWSTNGKASRGTGESATISFDKPQTVGGLMLWNGYQRSDTHYKANGRVKRLRVNDQEVSVKDAQGAQIITLPKPITTDKLTLTITDIYPGGSYKDVLISELRPLAPDGGIILPQVKQPSAAIPTFLDFVRDMTFTRLSLQTVDLVAGSEILDHIPFCPDASIRLRGNGAFVIYKEESAESNQPSVIEGNWEVTGPNTVRLFGKKYVVETDFSATSYLSDSSEEASKNLSPKIFQSTMTIRRYADLPPKERNNMLRRSVGRVPMWKQQEGETPRTIVVAAGIVPAGTQSDHEEFTGGTLDEALRKLDARLLELNPVCVVSDVFSDILLPSAQTRGCDPGP